MSISHTRIVHALAITALAAGLAACGPSDNQTAGQKLDNAVEATRDATANAVEASKEATHNAIEATKEAGNDALAVANEAGINAKVNSALVGDPELSATRIDVDVVGTQVTLTGTAPNAEAKARAESMAKAVEGVTAVNNQLTIP